MKIFQPIITGSLNVSGSVTALSFTGSLQGTASFSVSSSYALVATSASYAETASFASTFVVSGDITGSNALFTGTITAQTLNVQTVSSSIIYSSGSNIFGDELSDIQQFTGSVSITGSLIVNDSLVIVTNQTSSMSVLSASYANNSTSASYALVATSASYALNATSASQSDNANTSTSSSYALNATSASQALDANTATSASYALNATSASYALNSTTASYALNATSASQALDANTATSASYALVATSASYAQNATSASYSNNSTTSSYALNTTSASYAEVTTTSSYALEATSASYAFNSTSASYALTASFAINGNGGTGSINTIPKFTSTDKIGDSIITELSDKIGIDIAAPNNKLSINAADPGSGLDLQIGTTSYSRFGIINPGVDNDCFIGSTINNDFLVRTNNTEALRIDTAQRLKIANIQNATTDTDQFLVSDGGIIKYRTGAELLSDLGSVGGGVTSILTSGSVNGITLTGGPITTSGSIILGGTLENIANSQLINSSLMIGTTDIALGATGSILSGLTSVSSTAFTGSLFGTSSFALNSTSASYAATSSHATNFKIQTTLDFSGTLTDYASVNSSVVGSNNLFTQPTSSYTSAFFKYTVYNGVNARSGEIMSVWNGTTVEFTDTSTADIGTTTPVTASIAIVAGEVQLNIQTNTSGWRIKSIGTFI